ncbi:MAG: sigma-70 family RNA polymerase sigma factor [Deltaproteobacteria bacterium]|nr:sigma-70 family RNA polymerase sigma factor [Deltaproteobacteria bacterium]
MESEHAKNGTGKREMDDVLQICRLSAEGDEKARRQLMEMLYERIHRTASYVSANLEDAKDIAQVACVEVLLSAGSYRGEASLQYWADRVTIQTAAKMFTKRKRRQNLREKFLQPSAQPMATDEQIERSVVRNRLTEYLHEMKHKQREAVVLRYIHGYTNQQVADLCGIPLETARARLKKGRAELKKRVLKDPLLAAWVKEWGEQ